MLGEINPNFAQLELYEEKKIKIEDEIIPQKVEVKVDRIKARWENVSQKYASSKLIQYLFIKQSDFMLQNISVNINPGELLAVIGESLHQTLKSI